MKKNLKVAASIALLSSLTFASLSTLQPKSSHAAIGAILGGPTTMIVGGSIMGLGALAFGFGAVEGRDCNQWSCLFPGFVMLGGVGIGAIGLIVLDDQSIQFGHLTQAQAMQAKLTHAEWMSYEDELAEANAVFQDELLERKTEFDKSGKVSVENSALSWKIRGAELSPETFSALKKIGALAVHSAQSAKH